MGLDFGPLNLYMIRVLYTRPSKYSGPFFMFMGRARNAIHTLMLNVINTCRGPNRRVWVERLLLGSPLIRLLWSQLNRGDQSLMLESC